MVAITFYWRRYSWGEGSVVTEWHLDVSESRFYRDYWGQKQRVYVKGHQNNSKTARILPRRHRTPWFWNSWIRHYHMSSMTIDRYHNDLLRPLYCVTALDTVKNEREIYLIWNITTFLLKCLNVSIKKQIFYFIHRFVTKYNKSEEWMRIWAMDCSFWKM